MNPTPLSLRAFAKRLGVSHPAVVKAIKAGRLVHAVSQTRAGQPQIVDFALGKQEWYANAAKPTKPTKPRSGTAATATTEGATLTEAQRLLTLEKLRAQRLEIDRKLGTLVKKSDVTKVIFEGDRMLRESILNVPARLAGELAAEQDAGRVHLLLDAALREALTSVANQYAAQVSA